MRKLVVFLALCFIAQFVLAAVSASQAVDFVSASSFVNSGETSEIFPAVQISHSSVKYWIVTLLSNNAPSGFVAVKASVQQPEVSSSKTVNEQLFKTAYFLRAFLKNKDNAGQQGQWFFTQQNIDFFNTLGRVVQSEKDSDLSIISSEAKLAVITSKVNSLKQELDEIKQLCEGIAEKTSQELSFESSYLNSPSTQQANSLLEKLQAVKEDIDSLEQKAIDYESKASDLKKAIADANLELQQKTILSNLATMPSSLAPSVISSKKQAANSNIQAIQQSLQDAVSNSVVFADSFQSRLKKNQAYSELYSEDSVLKEKTKVYSMLNLAVQDILSESKADLWKNQAEVKKLGDYWSAAEKAYKGTNYDLAIEQAQKAKNSIVLIAKAGFVTETPPIEYNTDVFIQAAIGIALVLVLIFFIQKILPKLMKPKGESAEDLQEEFRIKR